MPPGGGGGGGGPLRNPTPTLLPAGIKKAVAEHNPKVVFLTSPNNPDGSMLSTEELREILELPTLVVLVRQA